VGSSLAEPGDREQAPPLGAAAFHELPERRRCRWGDCEAIGSVAVAGHTRRPSSGRALRLVLADEAAQVGRPFRLCETHADDLTRLIVRLEYPDGRVVFKGDAGLSC
jgi:hypothetical protein